MRKQAKLFYALDYWSARQLRITLAHWKHYVQLQFVPQTNHIPFIRILFRWMSISLDISIHSVSPIAFSYTGLLVSTTQS